MQRRDFIKGTCRICLLGAATSALSNLAASCSPAVGKSAESLKPVINDGKVEIPLSRFESSSIVIISPANYNYEIAILKTTDEKNKYRSLLLSCTHYENQLTITGNGYVCAAHGSRFDREGNVLKGPAEHNLKTLKTEITNDSLIIYIS